MSIHVIKHPNFNLEKDEYIISYSDLVLWTKRGMRDMIERFNIKKPEGIYGNFDTYYFKKRNPNRYFKKHLGFTYHSLSGKVKDYPLIKVDVIKVYDYNKLFLFKLKHGL
jgi:hypothetical protein